MPPRCDAGEPWPACACPVTELPVRTIRFRRALRWSASDRRESLRGRTATARRKSCALGTADENRFRVAAGRKHIEEDDVRSGHPDRHHLSGPCPDHIVAYLIAADGAADIGACAAPWKSDVAGGNLRHGLPAQRRGGQRADSDGKHQRFIPALFPSQSDSARRPCYVWTHDRARRIVRIQIFRSTIAARFTSPCRPARRRESCASGLPPQIRWQCRK